MSFLNPFFLIGAVVLAVPVLIHLVRREKSEVIRFSSLMFLLKVPKRAVRQQILKNLLLMLLRLLILACWSPHSCARTCQTATHRPRPRVRIMES